MKILGTGLSGLVGSRIVELLKDNYEFESSKEDIIDEKRIEDAIISSSADIILHLAAKTDVDGCEKDKIFGEEGKAWKINVVGTKNIADACSQSSKRLIYISTDFVFDGEKSESYTEEDQAGPINWYGKTKYEGELVVQRSVSKWLILRIAFPYRANFEKKDFVRKIIDLLKEGKEIKAITDQKFTPTFIDDIAFALDVLIKKEVFGILHVVGDQFLTPYEAAKIIAREFNLDSSLIGETIREEYFKKRAQRPFNLSLSNAKIERLGIKMRTFEEGLKEIKSQMKL